MPSIPFTGKDGTGNMIKKLILAAGLATLLGGCFNTEREKVEEFYCDIPEKEIIEDPLTPEIYIPPESKVEKLENLDEFNRYLTDNEKAMVSFVSYGCAACRRMYPFVEEMAVEYDGQIAIAAVTTYPPESTREIRQQEDVTVVPSFNFYQDGEKTGHSFIAALGRDLLDLRVRELINGWVPNMEHPEDYLELQVALMNSELPTMVLFYQNWHVPSVNMIAPFEEASIMYSGQILDETQLNAIEINDREAPEAFEAYAIDELPTIAFFDKNDGGEMVEVGRLEGDEGTDYFSRLYDAIETYLEPGER